MLNLFGYSLLYFVPAAIVSVLPTSLLQWLMFVAAVALACYLQFKNLPEMCKFENDSIKLVLFGISFTLIFMMASSMKLKFYSS